MAKWCGKIGYAITTTQPGTGVYIDEIVEKHTVGDAIRISNRWNNANSVNGNISISNRISIVADPYAVQNCHAIRYAEFMGALWKVTDVEVQYPRLLLTLGEVYNG